MGNIFFVTKIQAWLNTVCKPSLTVNIYVFSQSITGVGWSITLKLIQIACRPINHQTKMTSVHNTYFVFIELTANKCLYFVFCPFNIICFTVNSGWVTNNLILLVVLYNILSANILRRWGVYFMVKHPTKLFLVSGFVI